MTSRTLSSAYGKLISPTAQADFKANQGILVESAKDGINDLILNSTLSTVDQQNFGAALRDSDDAAIQKLRGKMTKGEKETFDRLYEDYNQAKSNLANPTEGLEAEKNTQFSKLPQEVQSAFLFLKQFGIDMKPLQTRVNNARTALKTFLENNPGELTDAEVKEKAALKLEKQNAETALTKYKKKDDSLLARLKTLGYGDNARKLFAGYAMGGMVYANRGLEVESSKYALGTDTIPAMLTAGEFVMKKAAVDRIGAETLTRMNDGTSSNESVYNYNITVNANSSDTSDIADAVLRQIKRVDSQRIRSSAI
jgi:hypothetical protein